MTTDGGGTDLGVGSDSDHVDLRALEARVQKLEQQQQAIVETLDRDLRFAAKELRGLLN